jgi:hypothetical protein
MRYEKIFEPNLIVKLMKESIEFLANKELLVDINIERGIDKQHLHGVNFNFRDNKIYINGLPFSMQNTPWRAIDILNNRFWFENARIDKFEFEHKSQLEEEIQYTFDILSKNKKNKLEKLLTKLLDKLTIKRIMDFLMFLDKYLEIRYSTVYGFDGGAIKFEKIYPYNLEGEKKYSYRKYIRNNLKEMKELQQKMDRLKEDNKRYKEKVKNSNGLIL